MAPVTTPTKLSVTRWAELMGIHPLHFQQVRLETTPNQLCSDIYFQYEWQNSDHISREEIARAIREAEDRIEELLGYRLAPGWEVDEWRPTTRPFRPEFVNLSVSDIRGYRNIVEADWGYFISGGIQSKESVGNAAITYTDPDGDGYSELATVNIATVALDSNEIHIFYPGEDGDEEWEIKPIKVTISGGTATITFRRELAIIPEKLYVYDIEGAEAVGTNDAHFLTTVDVFRIYNDPQTQVSFLWEPLANAACASCNGNGCSVCAYATQTGCLTLRGNPRNSLVAFNPGTWDNVNDEFTLDAWAVGRQPDIVRLYYYAGFRDKRQTYVSQLSKDWERTVAYMAAAILDRPPCDCGANAWRKWREDFALANGDPDGVPRFRTPAGADRELDILNNPFGTRRGEIMAWYKVKPLIKFSSVNLHA